MPSDKSKSSCLATAASVLAAVGAAITAYSFIARPLHLRWGASLPETKLTLPGDEFIPEPKLNATHAVTINAPVERVWPWLVQIGQGRGGFYSYEWIENLMGLDIQNVSTIRPELQDLKVGDQVPLSPEGFGMPVAIVDASKTLVLFGDTRRDPGSIPTINPGDYISASWGWYLQPVDGQKTRLVERWRADWNNSLTQELFMRIFMEPGAFLMERKMLLGIKQRAEQV